MHYTPHQYARETQVFAGIMLVTFLLLMLAGQTAIATVMALVSFSIYVYGRLAD